MVHTIQLLNIVNKVFNQYIFLQYNLTYYKGLFELYIMYKYLLHDININIHNKQNNFH